MRQGSGWSLCDLFFQIAVIYVDNFLYISLVRSHASLLSDELKETDLDLTISGGVVNPVLTTRRNLRTCVILGT